MSRSSGLFGWLLALFVVGCGDTPMPQPSEPAVAAAPAVVETGAAAGASAAPNAPPPPSPIDGALPATIGSVPLALRVDRAASGGCKPIAIADLAKKLPATSPVAVFEVSLGDKGCVSIPKDEGLEVAGVVLAGRARLEADGTKAPVALDAPWVTFRAPGAGLALRGVAGARLAVAVVATSGEPIVSRKPGKSWAKRKSDPVVVKLDASPDLAWVKGAYHARIAFATKPGDEPPALAVDTLHFSPEAGVAEHVHDKQWECLVALEGDGQLVQKPGGGAPDLHDMLAPGAILCIPPNRPHLYAHGKSRLVALQIYAPPGPEQRFVKLANP